jgi:hypothetical protein
MNLFRRGEPLHVRLAREGGIDLDGHEQATGPRPPWDVSGIHGLHRARRWDAVTMVDAADLPGEQIVFVVLPTGDLVAEDGGGDLSRLAAALTLEPAYRAEAIRRSETVWALGARRIDVVELPGVEGEHVELSSHGGERTLRIDDERVFGSIPALERDEHVVRARRIEADYWEVETHPL